MIDNNSKKCCFSGYRPSKFPFKLYNGDVDFDRFLRNLNTTITALIDDGCYIFYSGMAMGFDIVAAETVLTLKKKFPQIKLICALPFENQEVSYTDDWRWRYNKVLEKSDEIIMVSKEYHNGCYQNRNKYMVDNSDYVVTWYDGQLGGTRNTLTYAEKHKRYIVNLNTEYIKEFNNAQIRINF